MWRRYPSTMVMLGGMSFIGITSGITRFKNKRAQSQAAVNTDDTTTGQARHLPILSLSFTPVDDNDGRHKIWRYQIVMENPSPQPLIFKMKNADYRNWKYSKTKTSCLYVHFSDLTQYNVNSRTPECRDEKYRSKETMNTNLYPLYPWRITLAPQESLVIHECDTQASPLTVVSFLQEQDPLFRLVLVDENPVTKNMTIEDLSDYRIMNNTDTNEIIHWLPISSVKQLSMSRREI
jgi:hypothetical protein